MTWERSGQCMGKYQRPGITSNKDLAVGEKNELVVPKLDKPVTVKQEN